MLEAILQVFKKPSNKEPKAANLESLKKQIIIIAQHKSNYAAFLIDLYLKEFVEFGGDKSGLYTILLPVYEQAYLDQLKVAEEFKGISGGIYYDKILKRADDYASEVRLIKSRLKTKARASST